MLIDQYKKCPRCGAVHPITNSTCPCGHQFSTNFSQAAPSNPTQAFRFIPSGPPAGGACHICGSSQVHAATIDSPHPYQRTFLGVGLVLCILSVLAFIFVFYSIPGFALGVLSLIIGAFLPKKHMHGQICYTCGSKWSVDPLQPYQKINRGAAPSGPIPVRHIVFIGAFVLVAASVWWFVGTRKPNPMKSELNGGYEEDTPSGTSRVFVFFGRSGLGKFAFGSDPRSRNYDFEWVLEKEGAFVTINNDGRPFSEHWRIDIVSANSGPCSALECYQDIILDAPALNRPSLRLHGKRNLND